jgi:hypothetical protein
MLLPRVVHFALQGQNSLPRLKILSVVASLVEIEIFLVRGNGFPLLA